MILLILAASQLVNVITGPVGTTLQMTDHHKLDFANHATLLLMNVMLNAWLIPRYHSLGAAIATAVSLSAVHLARVAEVVYLHKHAPYNRRYVKPFVAAGGSAAMVTLLRPCLPGPPLVRLVSAGVCVFVSYVVVFVGLSWRDSDVVGLRRKLSCRAKGGNG